jgi:hypothetical protein
MPNSPFNLSKKCYLYYLNINLSTVNYEFYKPLSALRARSPSFLFIKATKPQLRPRAFSSSERGHMILMLASGPYFPNTSMSCCSVICTQSWSNQTPGTTLPPPSPALHLISPWDLNFRDTGLLWWDLLRHRNQTWRIPLCEIHTHQSSKCCYYYIPDSPLVVGGGVSSMNLPMPVTTPLYLCLSSLSSCILKAFKHVRPRYT